MELPERWTWRVTLAALGAWVVCFFLVPPAIAERSLMTHAIVASVVWSMLAAPFLYAAWHRDEPKRKEKHRRYVMPPE